MKRIAVATALMILLFAVAAQAQTPAQAPKPGPEVQRLGYFVGTWKMEGETKDSPISKAGKPTATEIVTWFEGGFFTVLNGTSQGPSGTTKSLIIKCWNPATKNYQAYAITSSGTLGQAPVLVIRQVSVSAKTWVSTWDTTVGGKVYHIRMTQVEVSPASYTETIEYSMDGKTWTVYSERKYAKQ